jgi:hypothetical protein
MVSGMQQWRLGALLSVVLAVVLLMAGSFRMTVRFCFVVLR